jgi:response regulator RpfG family c-di-GMP phosphodiesterase
MNSVTKPLTFLIVDDQPFNLLILSRHLKGIATHLIQKENGLEAWNYLQERNSPIDLIITDIMMPQMSGVELMEQVRKHDCYKNVPMIATTGGLFDAQELNVSGKFNVVLFRPYNLREMMAHISRLCGLPATK